MRLFVQHFYEGALCVRRHGDAKACCVLRAAGCELQVVDCGLWVAGPQSAARRLGVEGYGFWAAMSASASVTSNKKQKSFARLGPAHLTHKTNKYNIGNKSNNYNYNYSEPPRRAPESHSKVNQLSSF